MALHGSPYGTEGWNGGSERVCVAAESSSQTEKLRSVAHDISQLTTASRGRCAPDTEETAPDPCGGVFFMDGRRRVDYVLVYHCKKRSSEHRLSIVSNGNVPVPCPTPSRRSAQPELVEAELEAGPEEGPGEAEKCLIREEFERGLQEEGLEIEHDKELRSVRFVRLHVPWATLSREAELLKIPVPTTTKYELKEKRGLAGLMNSFWEKINQPFQPAVPDPLAHTHSRVITQPFCRDKLHMFDMTSKNPLYDSATRGRIVFEILRRTTCAQTCQTMGINSLLAKGVYDAAFPLHDGDFDDKEKPNDRQLLHDAWANYGVFFKYQPVDLIRKYFGEKIGLYFAWLGVYTQLLIPASILGVLVFLYGFLTLDNNVPSQELCSARLNITMCPLCDGVCDYWPLSSVCSTAQASYLFDNHATVAFAIFMSLWAAVFLEQWKRRQRCLQHSWDLSSMEDEEDELRPAYEDFLHRKQQKKGKKKKKEEPEGGSDDKGREKLLCAKAPQPPFMSESLSLKDRLPGFLINISSVLLMVGVTFSAVSGVILYRIIVFAVMSMNPDHEAKANVRVTVTTTAVIINLLVVLVLDEIYGAVAAWITELEIPKTEAEFEEHVILKAFLLKSMNAFAPVFYVAFFKGRFAGRPGDYVYVFKDFRMEECAPPGCLIEVCIQLGIIMLGKQLIQNNVFEVAIPKLKKMYRKYKEKQEEEEKQKEEESTRERQRWERDYSLEPYEGLSPEYMEMIIQYGFVTLFVASFPLAPVFALLNNVIEIRLDAAKFVTEIRRPDAVRAKEIGIWFDILSGISKFAVITNAFVISFTSDFIPRLVYQYLYSDTGSMHGFINNTLSYFNTSHFKPGTAPNDTLFDRELRICRYKDYRDPPWSAEAYQLSKQYWSVLAARLAFVIFFQNLAMFLSRLVAWLIPDVPRSLKEELKREKALLLELLLSEEMDRQRAQSQRPAKSDIIMKSPEEEEPESCGTAHTAEEPTDQSDDSQLAQSNNQSEKRVDTPSNTSEHELDAHCNEPIREQPEAHPFPKPSESVHSLSVVMETTAGPPDVEHAKPNSRQYEFTLDGPPIRDPDPKVKGRCRTLPPRCRLTEAAQSSTGTSHSTSFPHFSQSAALSHPLSKLDSQSVALSKQDIKSAALPRPPSKTELIASQTAALPRPPSKQDIIANNETEPPTHAQDTRVKGRCRTLPPTCRLIEAAQSSRGTSHSTSFPHLSQSAALSHPLFKPESQSPALPRPPSKPDESQDSAV